MRDKEQPIARSVAGSTAWKAAVVLTLVAVALGVRVTLGIVGVFDDGVVLLALGAVSCAATLAIALSDFRHFRVYRLLQSALEPGERLLAAGFGQRTDGEAVTVAATTTRLLIVDWGSRNQGPRSIDLAALERFEGHGYAADRLEVKAPGCEMELDELAGSHVEALVRAVAVYRQ
jgi:hypothetical protein